MLKKLRRELAEIRQQKHKHFADLERIIKRCRTYYGPLFPKYSATTRGSKTVFHFNVEGVAPISLEKEHGARDHIPPRYANFAIQGIEDLLNYIEMRVPDEEERAEEEEPNESALREQAATAALPEPEIPDGDNGG